MFDNIVEIIFLIMVGIMVGEWIVSKTTEFSARRKIWSQFIEVGLPENDAKEIVRRWISLNKDKQN